MFVRWVIDEVKKILDKINLEYDDLVFVKCKEDVYFLHCYSGDKRYIVKRYEREKFKEIEIKYKLMEKYGISPISFIVESNVVVYEDLTNNEEYRELMQEDFKYKKVVENIAEWYKKLYLLELPDELSFNDDFTRDDIVRIMNKFKLENNEALVYVYNNYDNINLKIKRCKKVLTNDSFSLENQVICEKDKSVVFTDFDCLKIGNKYEGIREILHYVGVENVRAFSGCYSEEDKLIDCVCSTIEKLNFASRCTEVPRWISGCLDSVSNGELLRNARCLVEWH